MDPADAIASVHAQLVSETVSVETARPMSFLRHMASRPRGLWARADEWVAHAGAVVVLDASRGEDRFSRIRRAAENAVGDGEGLRFFGGFSFHDEHRPEELWSDFGPALFHLPEFELVSTEEGAVLRGTARVEEEGSKDHARARLRARLEDLVPTITGDPRSDPPRPVPCDRHHTNPSHWRAEVEGALAAIHSGYADKIVLARTLDVLAESPLDTLRVLDFMWRENRGAHVFMFEPVPGRLILGAAPETVATVEDGRFHATAVAGSIGRGTDEVERERLARRLLESEKDLVEHRIALDDMVQRLGPHARRMEAADHPHVLTLARIQHLETEIRAELESGAHVLELLETLHPTPAVCGLPRDAARDFLDAEEPFERGWYSGPVGWFDARGNGVFAPALRCAVARGREWRLFAGAGIVSGSDPALEWEETGMKFEPVLKALEASGAR